LNPKSGFECDVAEILLHCTTTTISSLPIIKSTSSENEDKNDVVIDSLGHDSANDEVVVRKRRVNCQTLLFSATLTRSLESLESMAGAGLGRLPLKTFIIKSDDEDDSDGNDDENSVSSNDDDLGIDDDNESNKEITKINKSTSIPKIPPGLRQEYIFMPSHVRDAYLITAVRYLMMNGGRKGGDDTQRHDSSGWNDITHDQNATIHNDDTNGMDENRFKKAKSAIIFVSTCERTALISGILTELGVSNVALHSLLTQNRRLASLAKFKSQHVRVLVATDVASRGLDIPTVDLVLNAELPRRAVDYIHRVGRTARAGRRGRAVSLVGERDVALVHACEKMSGRVLEKCVDVNDDLAVKMLGSVTKATRLTKMKLADIGFDELVKKMKERKVREKKERQKAERAAAKVLKKARLTK
jgi:ATP-dependent RNA helicase DDX49/DBP8